MTSFSFLVSYLAIISKVILHLESFTLNYMLLLFIHFSLQSFVKRVVHLLLGKIVINLMLGLKGLEFRILMMLKLNEPSFFHLDISYHHFESE